jgi:outer membrane immunogenic protein
MTNMIKLSLITGAAFVALSSGAFAADLAMPAYAPPATFSAPAATDWDGPYIGASVGYGWGTASTSVGSASTTGWLIGGQLGYNFHLSDNLVAGVEGNIDWDNQSGTVGGVTIQRNWDGSIRGRLGVDLDGILPYAEAGVAFTNASGSGLASGSNTQTGWTAGAGVEFKLSDQLSANVEYRYSDYGSASYGPVSVGMTDSTVRAGLNYHF